MPVPLKTLWYSPPRMSSTARRARICNRRICRTTSRGSIFLVHCPLSIVHRRNRLLQGTMKCTPGLVGTNHDLTGQIENLSYKGLHAKVLSLEMADDYHRCHETAHLPLRAGRHLRRGGGGHSGACDLARAPLHHD